MTRARTMTWTGTRTKTGIGHGHNERTGKEIKEKDSIQDKTRQRAETKDQIGQDRIGRRENTK